MTTTPLIAALATAVCVLALAWIREHRLRRSLMAFVAQIFNHQETK